MASTFQLLLNRTPADDKFLTALISLEVEENVDLPGAIQLKLPVTPGDRGDLNYVNDANLAPFANLALVATPEGGSAQCIFDGYALIHRLHLETETTGSTMEIWGQDASWLMNLQEHAREWVDVTDADVAKEVFGHYGITPSSDNTTDDSPSHTADGHSLMQRGSDIQFLRSLARRNGKFCRVACAGKPGQRTGYFAKPKLDGDPVLTLVLNDPDNCRFDSLDIEMDATRATAVQARQALFTKSDPDGVNADTSDSGLSLLDKRRLSDFTGQTMTVMLAAPVDDGGELTFRAQSLLREAGWFVRCEGEADVARLGAIIRAGTIVQVSGVGSLYSGKYYVFSVRHSISADTHKMKFVLMRNAVGPPPAAGGGALPGGLG